MNRPFLIRVLNYFWLLVVFPVAVAILVGVLGHSANLGIKTFLLIECGMAVLSPLLNAVISDGNHTHHHRENSPPQARSGIGDVVNSSRWPRGSAQERYGGYWADSCNFIRRVRMSFSSEMPVQTRR